MCLATALGHKSSRAFVQVLIINVSTRGAADSRVVNIFFCPTVNLATADLLDLFDQIGQD